MPPARPSEDVSGSRSGAERLRASTTERAAVSLASYFVWCPGVYTGGNDTGRRSGGRSPETPSDVESAAASQAAKRPESHGCFRFPRRPESQPEPAQCSRMHRTTATTGSTRPASAPSWCTSVHPGRTSPASSGSAAASDQPRSRSRATGRRASRAACTHPVPPAPRRPGARSSPARRRASSTRGSGRRSPGASRSRRATRSRARRSRPRGGSPTRRRCPAGAASGRRTTSRSRAMPRSR